MQHFKKEFANICNTCNKKFTAKKNLMKHLRDVHKNFQEAERMVVKKIKCPEKNCEYLCRTMKDLRSHIQVHHNIQIFYDILQFQSEIAFQEWKQDEENNTSSSFVTNRKKTTLSDGTKKQTFYCHRSGHYNPKGFGKYRMRSIGSCKIGVTCPAAMEITEYSNSHITVIYYKTHLGHFHDIVFLKLSKEEKMHLAEQIEQGFTFDTILDNEKECTNLKTLKNKRIHMLSKKDLNNIMRTIDCNKNKRESDKELKNKASDFSIEANDFIISEQSKIKKLKNINPSNLIFFYEKNHMSTGGILLNSNLSTMKECKIPTKHSPPSEIFGEESTTKIVVFPSEVNCPSITDIIFSPDENLTQSKLFPRKNFSTQNTVPNLKKIENHMDSLTLKKKIKLNRANLKLHLKEKMENLLRYLPKTEFLTPKQFGAINVKLDSIINIFNAAERKSDFKNMSSKNKKIKALMQKKKKKKNKE